MPSSSRVIHASCSTLRLAGGLAAILTLSLSSVASAQYGRNNQPITRLDPGIRINIRTTEQIDARQVDYRVFTGIVEQDVRGTDRRLAIPRGSTVELIVRQARTDELLLDLEAVTVNGQRYAIDTDPNRIVGTAGADSRIGSIVGTRRGGIRGRTVRVPSGTVMAFRLDRALNMGVADRGVTRDGLHYHDYYGRGRE